MANDIVTVIVFLSAITCVFSIGTVVALIYVMAQLREITSEIRDDDGGTKEPHYDSIGTALEHQLKELRHTHFSPPMWTDAHVTRFNKKR